MGLPLLPSDPRATVTPRCQQPCRRLQTAAQQQIAHRVVDDVHFALGGKFDVPLRAPDEVSERTFRPHQSEAIEIRNEAAAVVGRRDERLGLGLQHMGMQANVVTCRKIAGQFEEMRRAPLRPIDTEQQLHAIAPAPFRRHLLHHREIALRRRRLAREPAVPDVGRQIGVIDRKEIDVALVFVHRRHRCTETGLLVSRERGRNRFDRRQPRMPKMVDGAGHAALEHFGRLQQDAGAHLPQRLRRAARHRIHHEEIKRLATDTTAQQRRCRMRMAVDEPRDDERVSERQRFDLAIGRGGEPAGDNARMRPSEIHRSVPSRMVGGSSTCAIRAPVMRRSFFICASGNSLSCRRGDARAVGAPDHDMTVRRRLHCPH